MAAEPLLQSDDLVADPTAGSSEADSLRERRESERAEELALLRRKMDGATVFIAGTANVALQLSWPEVGYGVVESRVESGQATRHPFKRFRTTIGYTGIALLGSDEQRLAYRHEINRQHRQVRSTAESPVKYNAFNRDLQLWVASCLHYGTRDVMIRMHGPLTRSEEETLLRASARFGTTLQVPAERWHRTPEEFSAYWEAGLARADIGDRVGDYLRSLLRVDLLPSPLDRAAGPFLQWVNTGFLPEPIREQLGLTWSPRDQRRHDRLMRALGRISRPLPHVIRVLPIKTMMWNLEVRRRLGRPLV